MKKLLLILVILLSSCAQQQPMVWYKPNAQQGEFEQVRYQCLRESQQYGSSSYIAPNAGLGGYIGSSSSGMGTNEQLFGACMNAKHWRLQQAKSPQQNQSQTKDWMREPANYSTPVVPDKERRSYCLNLPENYNKEKREYDWDKLNKCIGQ